MSISGNESKPYEKVSFCIYNKPQHSNVILNKRNTSPSDTQCKIPEIQKGDSIKSRSHYKPEYIPLLIEHMKKGFSFETFGVTIGYSRKTLYVWADEFEEFQEAKDFAFENAQQFYEKRLHAKLKGRVDHDDMFLKDEDGYYVTEDVGEDVEARVINPDYIDPKLVDNTLLIFALKTRFHKTYGDKLHLEHTASQAINLHIDSDDAKL